jgi:hypothetical protein
MNRLTAITRIMPLTVRMGSHAFCRARALRAEFGPSPIELPQ